MKVGNRVKVIKSDYRSLCLQAGVYGKLNRNSFYFGTPGFEVILEDPKADFGPHDENAWNFPIEYLVLAEVA